MLDAGSLVSLRRVSHVYNAGTSLARPALAEIELDIPPGVSVAVIGPTASGKTTLLEILAGLTVPSSAAVRRRRRHGFPTGRSATLLRHGPR